MTFFRNYYATMLSQRPLTSQVIVSKSSPVNGMISMASVGTSCTGERTERISTSLKTPVQLDAITSYDEEEGIDCSPCCRNDIIRFIFFSIFHSCKRE